MSLIRIVKNVRTTVNVESLETNPYNDPTMVGRSVDT
jgi:hypothetical protein